MKEQLNNSCTKPISIYHETYLNRIQFARWEGNVEAVEFQHLNVTTFHISFKIHLLFFSN